MNANALSPYNYNWTKIKSSHFTILVEENHTEYGELVAHKAEQAFTALQKFSNKHPKNTFIIIDHTKGFSNGSASFFPYPVITLQPVLPAPTTSVGQYKDWLYELLVHEYTHILTFHNTRGLFTPLRWVFGSAISPGYFMPTWYQEGIAVFTETHLSEGGRLRSSTYRALQEELRSSNISFANEDATGVYPFGSTPYVYGAWLNQDVFTDTGITGAAKVHKTFSGRFPYFINGGYKKNTDKSLYKSWKKLFSKKKPSVLAKDSFQGRLPFWDDDLKTLYFIKKSPYLLDELTSITEAGEEKRETLILRARGILSYQVHKNKIYYLSLKIVKKATDHQVYSLHAFDMSSKKTTTINSPSENIHSFDINSEDQVVYIEAKFNGQKLMITTLSDFKKTTELLSVGPETRISFSRFQNSKSILFALKKPNKNEELQSINIKSLHSKSLLSASHIVGLEKHLKTFHVLTESNGLKYLHNLNTKNKTLVHSGIKSIQTQETDSFIISRLSEKGPYIFRSSFDDLKSSNKTAVEIKNQADSSTRASKEPLPSKPYSSFTKLLPHYIVPNAVFSPYGFSGEFLYGLSTGGQDPLGLHSYSVNISTDTITEKASASFNYTSRHFKMPISLSTGTSNEPLSLSIFRSSKFASLGSSYFSTGGFGKNFSLSFQGAWSSTDLGSNQEVERLGAVASLSYNRSENRARELAPRKGYLFKLRALHYVPGSDYFDYTQMNFGLRVFSKSPIAKTHRLIFGIDTELNSETLHPIFSSNSLNLPYRNAPTGSFALRGLPTGGIFATDSFALAHLEYRFPLLNINWGPGLMPGFFRRVTGALTADYGFVKGVDFINNQFVDYSTPLYSVGGELIFEGKLFYHVPASLQVGVYQFLNTDIYDSSPEVFISFAFARLPGLPY